MARSWIASPSRTIARLAVAGAAVFAHAPALGNGFVWLDHAHLEGGLALAKLRDLPALFTQGFAGTGFYRPLVALSLSLDAVLARGPRLFHATTLAFHVAASVMTAVAAEALGLAAEAQLVAGLLFAVHPVTSLVASAIAFRSEAMTALALLALVVFHERRRPIAAAAAIFAGALCKETALALAPAVVVALELDRARRGAPLESGDRRRLLGTEAVAFASALLLRATFAPAFRATFPPLSASEAIGSRLAALAKSAATLASLGLTDRTVCDAFAVAPLASAHAIAGAAAGCGVVYLAAKRRGPGLLFAIALLPSLGLVPLMRFWSPHYLYVPLAFGAMLAGEAAALGLRRAPLWASAAAAVLGVQTFHDDARFVNDETLWGGEVARNAACREGHFYLGEVARQRGDFRRAEDHYEIAIAGTRGVLSYVDLDAAYENIGVARLSDGRPAEARAAFRNAVRLATGDAERRRARHDLATAELLAGDAEAAARELEPEAARPDALPESILLRAEALRALRRDAEARQLFERLGQSRPGY
jgi:tetratricopeptide (TPR) repeat protein